MFTLPHLPFAKDSLSQFCSANTFDFHYGKHHATYVSKLNDAISKTEFAEVTEKDFEEILVAAHAVGDMAIFNNAAQHFNHSFFWKCLSPEGGGNPTGEIAQMIIRDFESIEHFKAEFENSAATLFGSGWVFLTQNKSGGLEIEKYSNADTPILREKKPILTLDVWEHAYYLDFQNARPRFAAAFWEVVNWNFANENLVRGA